MALSLSCHAGAVAALGGVDGREGQTMVVGPGVASAASMEEKKGTNGIFIYFFLICY
jgi:hypothetical protein